MLGSVISPNWRRRLKVLVASPLGRRVFSGRYSTLVGAALHHRDFVVLASLEVHKPSSPWSQPVPLKPLILGKLATRLRIVRGVGEEGCLLGIENVPVLWGGVSLVLSKRPGTSRAMLRYSIRLPIV